MRALPLLVFALALAPFHALAVEAGQPAPGVSAQRLGSPGTTTLAEFRGKVVYVDFWASWCVPCRLAMPALDGLSRRLADRGFVVVGVNKDASEPDAERFLRRVPVSFVLVSDANDAVAKAFVVKAMPSGYLIDRKGQVRKVHRGYTADTITQLAKEVDELLKEGS